MAKGKNTGKQKDNLGQALLKGQKRHQGSRRGERKKKELLESDAIAALGFSSVAQTKKSVTEVNELEAFLADAVMSGRSFEAYRQSRVIEVDVPQDTPSLLSIDTTTEYDHVVFDFHDLPVPRRPAWTREMTAIELAQKETTSFLRWRKHIADLQAQNSSLQVTPFEKNIDYWRQLWRVIERSHVVVQVVDARSPLLFRCPDIEILTTETHPHKLSVLLVNKADYLSEEERENWREYFLAKQIPFIFFSAKFEQESLDSKQTEENAPSIGTHSRVDLISRDELLLTLETLAKKAFEKRGDGVESPQSYEQLPELSKAKIESIVDSGAFTMDWFLTECLGDILQFSEKSLKQLFIQYYNRSADTREIAMKQVITEAKEKQDHREKPTAGMIGYPNVGKSSVINVLCGVTSTDHHLTRVSVAATPGHTKHFQTVILSPEFMLCDCPGLVFPTFMNSKADLLCNGILPIDEIRGRDFFPAIETICRCIKRGTLAQVYGISFPLVDSIQRVPAQMLLEEFCKKRNYMGSGHDRFNEAYGARILLKDFVRGKLCYCSRPPSLASENEPAPLPAEEFEIDELALEVGDQLLLTESLNVKQASADTKKYGKKGKKNRSKNPYTDSTNLAAMSSGNKAFTRVVRSWDEK